MPTAQILNGQGPAPKYVTKDITRASGLKNSSQPTTQTSIIAKSGIDTPVRGKNSGSDTSTSPKKAVEGTPPSGDRQQLGTATTSTTKNTTKSTGQNSSDDSTRERIQLWFRSLDPAKVEGERNDELCIVLGTRLTIMDTPELRNFLQRFVDQMFSKELYEIRGQASVQSNDYGFMVFYKLSQLFADYGLPKTVSKLTTKAVQKEADEDATDTIIKAQISAIIYLQSSFKFNNDIDPRISIAETGNLIRFPVALYADTSMKKTKLVSLEKEGNKTVNPLVEFDYNELIQSQYIPIYHTKGAPWMYAAIQRSVPVHPVKSTNPKVPNLLSLYNVSNKQGMTPDQRWDANEKNRLGQYVKVASNERGLRDSDSATMDWVFLEIAKKTLNSLLQSKLSK
ncbi:hypothetical protein MMC11_000972 [Xylographa trunciseda]|nr:hypothetical protein [Xylographa trunciseda]